MEVELGELDACIVFRAGGGTDLYLPDQDGKEIACEASVRCALCAMALE